MELPEWEPMDEAELDAIESEALHYWHSSGSKTGRRKPTSCSVSTTTGDTDVAAAPHSTPCNVRHLPSWGNATWNLSRPSCRGLSAIPSARYPLLSFGGRIVYSRTVDEVVRATTELLEIIQVRKQKADNVSVGFDIEWKPTFKRGEETRKAATIQLCAGSSHCFVMHIIHSGIPPILEEFLKDNSFIKVGVGIDNDAIKIRKDYNVHVEALYDLSSFANMKLGGIPRKWGLCSLVEVLTSKQLAKPKRIRLGNWEVDVLSKDQLKYAATDAFASWYLFEALKSFPDANKDENSGNVEHSDPS